MALLVPPCAPPALAEAILRCARDPELRSKLASNARLLFESRYTEDRMLKSYRHLYLNLWMLKGLAETSVIGSAASGTVRKAERGDLPGIVAIHLEAFKNFFLTRLGRGFLQRYYELVLRYRGGILLVREGRSGLEGFACGFVDPEEFYRLMSRNRRMFTLPILSATVRHPSLVANIIASVQRVETQASQTSGQSCELSSVAVRPEARGSGAGKALLRAFAEQAWSLGAQYVYLDTDAEANEPANALYRKVGFEFCRRFQKNKGRWMNQYVLDREAANQGLRGVLHEQAASRH